MWGSLCRITNIILKEWYRVQAGVPSCLDRHHNTCDWVPRDFVDRFVTKNVAYATAAKEIEYSYCKRWTGGGQILDTATNSKNQLILGVPLASRLSLTKMRTFLDARRDAFEALLKTVPVQAQDNFGKVKTDGNHIGNGTFGGGYSYTLDWHALAYRWPNPGERDTHPEWDGKICRLGGTAHAGFEADATLFGIPITIVDADVKVAANENDDHQAQAWGKLIIATYSVFNEGPIDLSVNVPPVLDKIDTNKPQFVEAPFQVGWVTVTVKAGILFDYGVKLSFNAQAPQAGDCNPVSPSAWEASGIFQPQADLGVWVSADVSLAGILGVGIEVDLILVGLGLPLTVDVKLAQDPGTGQFGIMFDAELDLTLTTLKGELDFYIIAFWTKVGNWKIVGWDGFTQKFPIFRTRPVWIDLGPLTPGSIHPPGQSTASEDI